MTSKASPQSKTSKELGVLTLPTFTVPVQRPKGTILEPFATLMRVLEGSNGVRQCP